MKEKSTKEKILGMDDASFSELVRKIAAEAGADKAKTENMVRNIGSLRSSIANMSDADAERLLNSVGKENAENIKKKLNGNGR